MYAIISASGKQYKVQQGDIIYIDKLDKEDGDVISFDVLLLGKEDATTIGAPIVEGAKVEGKVLGQVKGEKIIVFKYKAKKNIRRKQGHRQPYTKLTITGIEVG